MAQLDAGVAGKVERALAVVGRRVRVVRAYLFGSQVAGGADRWSDIDLAVFVEGVASWTILDRARLAAEVQREAGDDVELHLLPAQALEQPDPASFAAWVLAHGSEVSVRAGSSPAAS